MRITRRSLLENSGAAAALATLASACARPDITGASELAGLDAVETAARIRSGALSAKEAVDAAIARAEALEPSINAIAFKRFNRARENAGGATGPWAGVPTFIKDLDDVIGEPTGFGSRAFPGYKGKEQSPLVNAYLGLGVVSLGKSTTPEFGLTATTEPLSTGKTRNPWNTDYSTGGSSGGAAALVAAGVVPVAHASDGGGSIRIPAACCGNVGLKVSRNRFPFARPDPVGPINLSVHGVQSRTVRDTAAVIAAMEQAPEVSGLPPVGLVTGPARRRLRIAMFTAGGAGRAVDPEVAAAARAAGKLCEDLGHSVEEMVIGFGKDVEEAFLIYWAAMAEAIVTAWESATKLKRNGLAFEPFTLGLVEFFEARRDKLASAITRLQEVTREYEAMFASADILLSPVLAAPPARIGWLDVRVDFPEALERVSNYAQFTGLNNIAGAPAISLPLATAQSGLPIGVMFSAGAGDEKTLLELSYEIEQAAPWTGRKPPKFGGAA
ncbi:MAG TPA: amidase [Parvularcula sp.]|nr:amidase [Parvularcula sp.]